MFWEARGTRLKFPGSGRRQKQVTSPSIRARKKAERGSEQKAG